VYVCELVIVVYFIDNCMFNLNHSYMNTSKSISFLKPKIQISIRKWIFSAGLLFVIVGVTLADISLNKSQGNTLEAGLKVGALSPTLSMPKPTLEKKLSRGFTQNQSDSLIQLVNALTETDYTIPSWTLLRRAYTSAVLLKDATSTAVLQNALNSMKSKEMPYSVVVNIYGNPASQMAFTWFTNQGVAKGAVQVVSGEATQESDFNNPLLTVNADTTNFTTNYCVSANGLQALAGIPDNSTRSYSTHKVVATGLSQDTKYSFRVGTAGSWSSIGSFTTAKATNEPFSFIYFTDSQAQTDAMFDVSQKTMHKAKSMLPNAKFILNCGDLVESSGDFNSEWEYEQFFSTQQDIWLTTPLAPVMGNHDYSSNKNFQKHFHTKNPSFDLKLSAVPGSVYSFTYGDALFMAIQHEDYSNKALKDSIKLWLKQQIDAHPDKKWRIAFFHKTMYTGSVNHQGDFDQKTIRDYYTPVFDSLKIDLAIQGHDHVYEVIGPLKAKALVSGAVSNQTVVTPTVRDNLTGRLAGTFDVKVGTLYFLNNSAGEKKYEPRTQSQMAAAEKSMGLINYFSFFTGRFGQNGYPTFSNISVSTDSINVTTYYVDHSNAVKQFDAFKIVKSDASSVNPPRVAELSMTIYPNPTNNEINVQGIEVKHLDLFDITGQLVKSATDYNPKMNVTDLQTGNYILKATTVDERIVVSKISIYK
jgi:hypothetical protein